MTKLSPAYREDDTNDLPADVREYLDVHFLQKLENLHTVNPKILVVFSGGNAVGKSTLSQKIGQEFSGLVLENDAIKKCLITRDPAISREDLNVLTWKYSIDLYKRLGTITPNGLVVRDGVIHWYYDRLLPIFEAQGYKLFIIAYELSKEKQIDLINARGDTPTVTAERLITIMQDHDVHLERFKKAYTPNVTLHDDNLFDHDRVIKKLRTYIG